MSRKSLIKSCALLAALCAVLALIPTAIRALDQASLGPGLPLDPRQAAASLLGADADDPSTLADWLGKRGADDPAQLKILATSDPEMSAEERARLLEEAEKNRPALPKPEDGAPGTRRRPPPAPAQVLPPDEPESN